MPEERLGNAFSAIATDSRIGDATRGHRASIRSGFCREGIERTMMRE
jgi:hypothetical protein